MKNLDQGIEISYPLGLIENLEKIPESHALPCSVLVNNVETGSLLIACSNQDINHYNLGSSPPPETATNYRMLNSGMLIYAIQIVIVFVGYPDKSLKLHLNPRDSKVKKFLKLCRKTKVISFHFYNTDTGSIASVVTTVDDDDLDWFIRNIKLSSKLTQESWKYDILAEHLSEEVSKEDRFYTYYAHGNRDCFVREGAMQVMLQQISNPNKL